MKILPLLNASTALTSRFAAFYKQQPLVEFPLTPLMQSRAADILFTIKNLNFYRDHSFKRELTLVEILL